jgi:hypothetical protein
MMHSCTCGVLPRTVHLTSPTPGPAAQAFVTHNPSSFDALWRGGALSGFLVTVCKLLERDSFSLGAAQGELLAALVPEPGQAPWYAASAARQQFALLVLARMGGSLAQRVGSMGDLAFGGSGPVPADQMAPAASMLLAVAEAGGQLADHPLLRELAAQAAPAARQAEPPARQDAVHTVTLRNQVTREVAERCVPGQLLAFLTSLDRQLDPLALGLALPGCYNPACTSLAGASEADMKLKRCTGCMIAR